jgi:hypothetical protein
MGAPKGNDNAKGKHNTKGGAKPSNLGNKTKERLSLFTKPEINKLSKLHKKTKGKKGMSYKEFRS